MTSKQDRLPLEGPAGPLDWHLDHRTRDIGRRGLADARAALELAARRAAARQAVQARPSAA